MDYGDRKARAIIQDDWVINKVCIETDSRNNRVIKLTGFKWIFEYWQWEEGRSHGWLQKLWLKLEWAHCYQSTKLICLGSLVKGSWDIHRDVQWAILYNKVWARSMGLGVVNELGRLGLTETHLFSSSVMSDSFVTPRTVACQAAPSMWFQRQEYWRGFSPGDLSDPGIKPICIEGKFFSTELPGKPQHIHTATYKINFICITDKNLLYSTRNSS